MSAQVLAERSTDVVAVGAVISPWWLPLLQNSSEIASLLLPIAGLLWIIIQAVAFVRKMK